MIQQSDIILETLKAIGIISFEEVMEQNEKIKKEVNERLNKSLNNYIAKNYSKYEQKAKNRT